MCRRSRVHADEVGPDTLTFLILKMILELLLPSCVWSSGSASVPQPHRESACRPCLYPLPLGPADVRTFLLENHPKLLRLGDYKVTSES